MGQNEFCWQSSPTLVWPTLLDRMVLDIVGQMVYTATSAGLQSRMLRT